MKFSQLPPCFIKTFARQTNGPVITETGSYSQNLKKYNVNLSSIATFLIQNVGRFCEHYASDFLITWNDVTQALKTEKQNFRELIFFGIRKSGVDHDSYILSNLETHHHLAGYIEQYYRKIFAVEIRAEDGYVWVTLKDVTNTLYYTNEAPHEIEINNCLSGNSITFTFDEKSENDEPQACVTLNDDSCIRITYEEQNVYAVYRHYNSSNQPEKILKATTLGDLKSKLTSYLKNMSL